MVKSTLKTFLTEIENLYGDELESQWLQYRQERVKLEF